MNIEEMLQTHPNLNVGHYVSLIRFFLICFGFAFSKSNVRLINYLLLHVLVLFHIPKNRVGQNVKIFPSVTVSQITKYSQRG